MYIELRVTARARAVGAPPHARNAARGVRQRHGFGRAPPPRRNTTQTSSVALQQGLACFSAQHDGRAASIVSFSAASSQQDRVAGSSFALVMM